MRSLPILAISVMAVAMPCAAQVVTCGGAQTIPPPVISFVPSVPNASQAIAATVGVIFYDPSPANISIATQGNSINITITSVDLGFYLPTPMVCGTVSLGRLSPGSYSVNLFTVGINLVDQSPHLAATSILTVTPDAQISYQVLPSAPSSLEAVRLTITFTGGDTDFFYAGLRSMSGNKITVTIHYPLIAIGEPRHSVDVDLGRFLPGNYTVEVVSFETQGTLFSTAFTVTETHARSPYPSVDYTDHWWDAQESGWGISIMQHPSDRLFAVWFVYNQSGQPVWYTLQGSWITFAEFTGPVYKTTGPYYGGPFDPTQVGITQVGTGTLIFHDYTTGTFSYTVEGVSGSKPITRLPF